MSVVDCPRLRAITAAAPAISGTDMQATSDLLLRLDKAHGYNEFTLLPATFMWWLRDTGSTVNQWTIGAAIHETNHEIDFQLNFVCNSDGLSRYLADAQIHVTGPLGATDNYSIAGEAYPAALRTSRKLRFDPYITGSAGTNGNRLDMLLDELNAYSGGANFEASLLASPNNSYLITFGDYNTGGMVDFMLFLQSYLQAARLHHTATYATIQAQPGTVAYVQFAWTRAEKILEAMYPHSAQAGGTQTVPADVLAQIYSAPYLAELDALGITHKTAADWATTYFR